MLKRKNRIVIDTNIWISFLLTKDFTAFDKIISSSQIILLFSSELLEEFIDVANRPKFKKYFKQTDLEELLFQMNLHGQFIDVKSSVNICRDPKDNFLLSLSKDGKATHLITGDKDLLALIKFEKTEIINLSKLISEI
ncbi:MAG: putative toxin-antitoxin system toxin component, PIN family [Ferruginibacter sp.]